MQEISTTQSIIIQKYISITSALTNEVYNYNQIRPFIKKVHNISLMDEFRMFKIFSLFCQKGPGGGATF